MLNDPAVLIFLIVLISGSFAMCFALIPCLRKHPEARVLFFIFLSLGLFVSYGLSIQKDGLAVFVRG